MSHLTKLKASLQGYFPEIETQSYDCIRNPFLYDVILLADNETIKDELIDLQEDFGLKADFREKELNAFWCSLLMVHNSLALRALHVLVSFTTTYLCEVGF